MGHVGCVALTQAGGGWQGHLDTCVCVCGFILPAVFAVVQTALDGSEPSLGLGGTRTCVRALLLQVLRSPCICEFAWSAQASNSSITFSG